MELYIYNPDSRVVIARIVGDNQVKLESYAAEHYGDSDSFASTYSPAFGANDGLVDNAEVEVVEL